MNAGMGRQPVESRRGLVPLSQVRMSREPVEMGHVVGMSREPVEMGHVVGMSREPVEMRREPVRTSPWPARDLRVCVDCDRDSREVPISATSPQCADAADCLAYRTPPSLPECPSWCAYAGEHGADIVVMDGRFMVEHISSLAADVIVTSTDVISRDGQVVERTADRVEVRSDVDALTAMQARLLLDGLAVAIRLLDDTAGGA